MLRICLARSAASQSASAVSDGARHNRDRLSATQARWSASPSATRQSNLSHPESVSKTCKADSRSVAASTRHRLASEA